VIKWILAAIGVVVVSMAVSAVHMHLSSASFRHPVDPAAYELNRQIELQYEPVSLVSLLSLPERYDGRKVRVSGFVTLAFEGDGLHLDRSAYEAGLRRNALWLRRPRWLTSSDMRRLNRRYGEVAGTFDASLHGHMGLYTGTLTLVQRIRPTLTESDYQRLRIREGNAVLMQSVLSGGFLTLVGWMVLATLWVLKRRGS
jgi:hypothetical protein